MKWKFIAVVTVLLLACIGCKNDTIKKVVKQLNGKILDFSVNSIYVFPDSVYKNGTVLDGYKYFAVVDSTLCLSCLSKYVKAIESMTSSWSILGKDVNIVLLFNSFTIDDIQKSIYDVNMDRLQIIYDVENKFLEINKLDGYRNFAQTFLLDNNNCIQLIGDPLRSNSVQTLYGDYVKELDRKQKK